MLRYKTQTRPGLVTLYNIQPGNGVCLFLQPQSPHWAITYTVYKIKLALCLCIPLFIYFL